jgi:hypothetical protein
MAGCETQVDWRFTTLGSNGFDTLFAQELPRRGICTNDINEYILQDQWGGTCVLSVGHLSLMVLATGADSTGLGRWSWIHIGGGGKTTCILVAYRPCQPH